MSNIREVAKAAGVSTATVSRYFSNPEKLAKKSATKVEAALSKLNYKPNLLARNFSKSRSFAILVLVPDIANPFFSRVIKGIEEVAHQKGYSVLLGNTCYSEDRELTYTNLVDTRQADGVIQLGPNLPFENCETMPSVPFVQACECLKTGNFPTVEVDNVDASKRIVEHLLGLGHRKIACILGPETSPLTSDRLHGYELALENAGIEIDRNLLFSGDFTMNSGFNTAPMLIQQQNRPTATFCMNDEMAIGLIRGLSSAGLRVPQDMSIAGFDDIEYAKYSEPPLTTVSQPTEDLGRTAMNYLYDLLEKESSSHVETVLPTQLVIRESTAKLV